MAIDEPTVSHATREDVPEILRLIQEHAEYEGDPSSCLTTEASLLETLHFALPASKSGQPHSAPQTSARALLVRVPSPPNPSSASSLSPPSVVAGLAVYVQNYSTWRGRPGIYLDDLFVRPQFRKRGLGRLLIQRVAQEVLAIGGCRLEWLCGATNTASREWYRALGAREMGEWIPLRLEWEALEEVAKGGRRGAKGPNKGGSKGGLAEGNAGRGKGSGEGNVGKAMIGAKAGNGGTGDAEGRREGLVKGR